MGALEQTVEKAIREVSEKYQIKQILTGTAKDVGMTTCTVERDDAPTLYDVRLNAIDDNLQSNLTVYPAEGSSVIVALIEGLKTEAVVLKCSEVSKVSVKIGSNTLEISQDGVSFNSGNSGLIKIESLTSKINELVNSVNSLVVAFNAHTHVVSTTGTAAAQAGTAAATLTQANHANAFNRADFEDQKIKH